MMRNILLSLLGLSVVSAFSMQTSPKEVKKNRFGAMEVTEWDDEGMKKTVMRPLKSFKYDYVQQADFLSEASEQIKYNQAVTESGHLYTCSERTTGDERSAGYFIPIFVADMTEEGQKYVFNDGMCFQDISFEYNVNYDEQGKAQNVTMNINAQKPKIMFCKDWFFIGNTELYHVEVIVKRGNHQITFTNIDENTLKDLNFGGLKVYMFCDGFIDTFISAFKFAMCFLGGLGSDPLKPIMGSHVPYYMEQANVKFLKEVMGYELEERETQQVEIDESLIQSGDFVAIMRLDGLDPIVMLGTGSHAGHTTMALRIDGELYIIESQDAWYWPVQNIQRNKWSDWIQYARNADFHVVHMPLSPEARAKFNETAAYEFFLTKEGTPYGYYNFLFGWIDTKDDNWPPILPSYFVPIIFSILEKVAPTTVDIFFNQALNHKLGTSGLNIAELTATAADRNMTIDEAMAIVEEDGWLYYGVQPRNTTSYVCSAFVTAVYKAAGMFEGKEVNAVEFSPKDVYQMNIFDLNYQRPQQCIDADPNSPFCQLNGKYRMTFPGYSTIDLYEHMNEKCPSIAPDYVRPDGC